MSERITCVDGHEIAYDFHGDPAKPVLLLSHALGASSAMWEPQLARFAEHFYVLTYDMRGHGRSSVPDGAYSLDLLGRDVVQLLDALRLETICYCGLSIGGMIGQWLGYRAPERLDRLVITNSSAYVGPPLTWQGRIDLANHKGMAPLVEPTLERWFTPGFAQGNARAVERIRKILQATDGHGYAGCASAIRDMDLRPTAPLIRVPMLIIAGEHDEGTPPDHARIIADAAPHAKLETIAAAHLSNVEQPDTFSTAVLNFLL